MQQAVAGAEAMRAASGSLALQSPAARAASLNEAVRSTSVGRVAADVAVFESQQQAGQAAEAEEPRTSHPSSAASTINVGAAMSTQAMRSELERKRAEVATLATAEAELRDLGVHRDKLRAQIEELRASPAAAEVIRLQRELLEMQGREVQELTDEVAGLAGVQEKLAALRLQHAELEREVRLATM